MFYLSLIISKTSLASCYFTLLGFSSFLPSSSFKVKSSHDAGADVVHCDDACPTEKDANVTVPGVVIPKPKLVNPSLDVLFFFKESSPASWPFTQVSCRFTSHILYRRILFFTRNFSLLFHSLSYDPQES